MKLRNQASLNESSPVTILKLQGDPQQSIRRPSRTYCGLSIRYWIKVLGSFLLPLLLAIFTMVITFDQRSESQVQRLEDRAIAREQREQDMNISILQRETDKFIAEERRIGDNLNAERQRNMSLEQRQHELIVEKQRYEKQQEQRSEDTKLAAEQRSQDLKMAEEQRSQDLKMAEEQRSQDLKMAEEQRSQDLKMAEEQRITDSQNAKAQRDNDLLIAERKQLADDRNAEKERNVSREMEEYRYEQAKNKDLDALLLAHINDIGVLLENHNGSLTKNPTIAALARAKTLHVIRSIGVERSTRLLQFLFDAGQLTRGLDQRPLDLSGAVLNRIDMSVSNDLVSMRNVSFVGVHMNEGTFFGQDLSHWNFTDASLIHANFSHTVLDGTWFRRANLTSASFAHSNGERCVFDTAALPKSTFYAATMGFANFQHADLARVNLEGSYLSGSTLAFASLIDAQMNDVYFLFANLSYANMLGAVCFEQKCHLHDALSLLYAVLPNGTNVTVGHRPISLLRNGHAVCITGGHNDDHLAGWHMLGDPIYITNDYHDRTCVFTYKLGATSVWTSMKQRGNVSIYKRLVRNGHAMVSLKAHRGRFTCIEMSEIDETGKAWPVLPRRELLFASETTVWENILRPTTIQIEVTLMFQVSRLSPFAWFEYIELTILLWLP